MDDSSKEAANGAPFDRHRQHAIHTEHDEKIVPDH